MDDLYDNLENYNEESTIAELQSENKVLKSKLEDYATSLDKLQKDFDKLSSEYKKLEVNYSSLIKTAKAEIERKTQMITNLNIEKDKIIIESYQNKRNSGSFHRHTPNDRHKINETKSEESVKESKPKQDNKSKETIPRKVSPPASTQRVDQVHPTPKDTSNVNTDTRNKWLNMANCGPRQVDPRIVKSHDVKENIVQCNKNETFKSSALIRNRRKSMPAICLELEKFSTDDDDDDLLSGGNTRAKTDKRPLELKFAEKQASRVSETSSLEDRHSGHHDPLPDVHRSRQSRYDNNRTDTYRTRHKSSHRYKRQSPDMYRREPNEHNYDNSHRRADHDRRKSEHDRHKSEHDRRRLESPPRDNSHWRRNREPPRNNYDRSHERYNQAQERHQNRMQENYPLKHKIQHNYDESDSKRMKIDPHHRREEDFRLQEPFNNINFSSCESPDYTYSDVSAQPIREIKLYAASKLDDPRMSNKKYCLNKDDGNVMPSTSQGRSVDLISINKLVWGIKRVNMPEALIRRPSMEADPPVNMLIDPAHDISIESGEISDHENYPISPVSKETKIDHCFGDSKNIGNVQKINNYKIPKAKKRDDDSQNQKSSKTHDMKHIDKKIDTINRSKTKAKPVQEKPTSENLQKMVCKVEKTADKKHNSGCHQMKNELPCLGSSDLYEKKCSAMSKEVVECDLEMSDDNCDNIEQPNNYSKHTHLEKHNQDKEQNVESVKQSIDVTKSCVVNVTAESTNLTQRDNKRENAIDTCKDKIVEDVKQISKDKSIENVKETSKDKSKENVKETRKDKFIENVKETNKDKSVENFKETSKDKSIENVKDTTKHKSVENFKETSKDKSKENVKETSKDKSIENVKETSKDKSVEDKKSRYKKKSKRKEELDSKVPVPIADKSVKTKEKEKETKTKQIKTKTKFIELFDDSNSLISPEDLGLVAVTAPHSTVISDKCNPFFEAQNATDIDSIKEGNRLAVIEKANDNKEHKQIDVSIDQINTEVDNTTSQLSDNVQTINKKVIENIYMNLEPDIPEKENNVVKTVIISMGIQPKVLIDNEEQEFRGQSLPQLKTAIQGVALQALATSTPQKMLVPNAAPVVEAKLPDIGCNTSDSRLTHIDDTATGDNSCNNTLDSQVNTTDAPDVRIVVRRKRRVVKK